MSLRLEVNHGRTHGFWYNYKYVEGTPPEGTEITTGDGEGASARPPGPHEGGRSEPGDEVKPGPSSSPATGMTLQADRRRVKAGDTVIVPVWLLKCKDVANINFSAAYDPRVAVSAGRILPGNLVGSALFEANPAESGLIRIGFAQTAGISVDGTVASLPFRAVGKPGDRTALHLEVSTINDPSGAKLSIQRVHGEILIVDDKGQSPWDCDGDGEITASDARCALQMSVRLRPQSLHMDSDADGQVTSNDARLILRRTVGKYFIEVDGGLT